MKYFSNDLGWIIYFLELNWRGLAMINANAVSIKRQGAPEEMVLEQQEIAAPGAGQLLIEQKALGLNYQDVYHRSGFYPLSLPSGIGTEAAGVVLACGEGVDEFKPGDRVAYAGGAPGAYSSHRIMPADRMVKLDDGVELGDVARVLLKGMTVEYLLNRCVPIGTGKTALVYAAAGGVGLLAGQWGHHLGATMIGIAQGEAKCSLARANGYSHVIDRSCEDVAARIRELTSGKGVDVVYDSVGKASFETSINALKPRGTFVSFGTTTGAPPAVEAAQLQKLGSLYFTRPTLVTYTASRQELLDSAGTVFRMLRDGHLRVHRGADYRLEQVVQAHHDLESGRTSGACLIIP